MQDEAVPTLERMGRSAAYGAIRSAKEFHDGLKKDLGQ